MHAATIIDTLAHAPARMLVWFVKGYRLLLSPWLGNQCRFEPTCSVYAIEALERHGAAGGTYLAARRILRCHPWCEGGHDPVPPRWFGRGDAVPRQPADSPKNCAGAALPAPRSGEIRS